MAILNGITNAFVSNLMGDSFSTQMKEFVKGFLCGFGLYSFAYFINAIYAISVLKILVVDVLAREASSAVMVVVSACDGDSSNVVKYEMQAAMYMLASVLLYRGTLPKNDMKPSKNGYSWKDPEAGSQAELGNKLDYQFGKAGGSQHNINRTTGLKAEMDKLGFEDTTENRNFFTDYYNDVLNKTNNIVKTELESYTVDNVTYSYIATYKESFLMGKYGGAQITTVWDENRLLSIIIKSGGQTRFGH